MYQYSGVPNAGLAVYSSTQTCIPQNCHNNYTILLNGNAEGYWTTRRLPTHGLNKSRTSQVAD